MPEDRKYLTIAELHDRLRGEVSLATLANWRSKGKGPGFVRTAERGGKILYPVEAVEAWERSIQVARRGTSG